MRSSLPTHPFWRFSCALRAERPIDSALNQLRDRREMNSTLLLFCCWSAEKGYGRFTQSEVRQLMDSIQLWHEQLVDAWRQVCGLFHGQHGYQSWSVAIKREVLECERDAIRIEHLFLAEAPLHRKRVRGKSSPEKHLADACHNIVNYCKLLNVGLDQKDLGVLYRILSAVFPSISLSELIAQSQGPLTGKRGVHASHSQRTLDLYQ